jgi:hypothetical protein
MGNSMICCGAGRGPFEMRRDLHVPGTPRISVPPWWRPPFARFAGAGAGRELAVPEEHATLAAAIKAASPGDRIVVDAGVYTETLFIDKPLEIVGRGRPSDVCVRAIDACALTVAGCAICRLENICLQVCGKRHKGLGSAGECSVGETLDEASLQLERCVIEGGSCGLRVGGSCAVLVDCVVRGAQTGLMSRDGSELWILRSSVHLNEASGIVLAVRASHGHVIPRGR